MNAQNKISSRVLVAFIILFTVFSETTSATPKKNQTITFGSAPILVVNGSGNVTAKASSKLTVTFKSLTATICSISGTKVSGKKSGTCKIAANQAGNSSYNAAAQVTQQIIVSEKKSQTITFGTAPTVSVGGTGIVSATATSKLSVSFKSLTATICSISGTKVSGKKSGTCTIAANQAGNSIYSAAAQVTQQINVKLSQTLKFGVAPTVSVGGTGIVSATATSKLSVSFKSLTATICSISGTTVTGIAIGTCRIAANQVGNTSYSAAAQVTQSIAISSATDSLALQVPGVATGTYSKMTLMAPADITALNEPKSFWPAGSNLLAKLSPYLFKEAQASIAQICSQQLVGYNEGKEAWELLPLTTQGDSACATSFISAGDYFLTTMSDFQVDGQYCNLLMMRKTDGKLFCAMEDTAATYSLTTTTPEISGNGRYTLIQASQYVYTYPYTSTHMLIRLDLQNPSGSPVLKTIWAVEGNGANNAMLTDHAPTNSGDAVIAYTISQRSVKKYVQVNAALDDPTTNTFVTLPETYTNIQNLLSPNSIYCPPKFVPDVTSQSNTVLILQPATVSCQNNGNVSPSIVRLNAINTSNFNYDFLGTYGNNRPLGPVSMNLNGIVGLYYKVIYSMDSTPPYTHYTYSVVAYTNPLTTSVDFSTVTLPSTWGDTTCSGFSGSDCTTDSISYSYDMTTEPAGLIYVSYGWGGLILKNDNQTVFWVAYDHANGWGRTYDRLLRVDAANKEGKYISIRINYIITGVTQSSRYPNDVLISGIDTDVGSGSPFAARITASGDVEEYSVLPQSFKTNPFKIVEIGS